jgi:hypothetical protein
MALKKSKLNSKTIDDQLKEFSVTGAEFFRWAPDAFAVTSKLLQESGAYRLVIDPHDDERWPSKPFENWTDEINELGEHWKGWFCQKAPAPPLVLKHIENILNYKSLKISHLNLPENWKLCVSILELHVIADAACGGIGLPGGIDDEYFTFSSKASQNLIAKGTLSDIDVSRIKILPKLRTPQVGISLRSLSHNLCFDESEVKVQWHQQFSSDLTTDTYNILVLPWPIEVDAVNFEVQKGNLDNLNPDFGMFRFKSNIVFDAEKASSTIEKATKKAGKVHGVILPECAIKREEVPQLEQVLRKHNIKFFISGVRDEEKNLNYAVLGMEQAMGGANGFALVEQFKHHRWAIDDTQIQNYHLGASLHPEKIYWENIKIKERAVNFCSVSDSLTFCHLLCEDLARHDPVAPLIRAVGPNLVVALLLDGPQLKSRWSARYATVLADDPGSSVLSVTSLGMALRSRPEGYKPSRVVALWKDPKAGSRELTLDEKKEGLIISVSTSDIKEWTADGRDDSNCATTLVLSGVECV